MRAERWDRARDVTITFIGSCGLIVLAWLALSFALNLSLTVFVTGSMSPSIPAGSAAVMQTVPAADLSAGDVVTVMRPGTGRPVTHRIIGIEQVDGQPDARRLTLKGDANDVIDSDVPVVDEAPRVIFALPYVGTAALWAKSPPLMIALTVLIALAIAWALWPTRRRSDAVNDKESTS